MSDTPSVCDTGYHCVVCGYDLSAAAIGARCPECGQPVVDTLRAREPGEKHAPMASLSLVLGIISAFACPLVSPFAVYVSHRTSQKVKMGGYDDRSRQMAQAGLILGFIGCALLVLLLVAVALRGFR